ncbi:hypothetical protein BGZ97_013108 [Linnemannia gamsii]|uniref:Uncharacterized protein n=1 Tax=Linnemannia gamsii TaxID=64522 RepID=A0A9P6UL10_9FUNG|nr:hypothetical protein BGZ97_013108 [Linnemannia gamsii]
MPRYSTCLAVRPPSYSSSIGLRDSYEYVDRLAALSVNKIPRCHEETRKVYDLQRMATALLQERNGPFIGSLNEKAADYCSVPYAADRDGQNTVFESGLTPAKWLKAQMWTFFPTEDSLMVFTMQVPNKPSGGDEEGGSVPLITSSSTSGVNVATSNEQPATASSTSTTAETATTSTSSPTAPTASATTTATSPSTTTTTRPLKKCIVVLPQSRHMTRSQTRQIQFNETQSTQYFSADEEVTQISAATAISSEGQHKVTGPPVLQEPLTTRDSHALRKEIKAGEKKAKAEWEAQQAAVREARAAAVSDMIQNEDDQLLAEKIQSQKERDRKRRDDRSDLIEEEVKSVEEEQTRKWIVEQRRRAVIEKDEQQQRQQWKEENKQQKDEDDDNAGEGSSSGRRRKTRRELQIERDEALARQLQATEDPSRIAIISSLSNANYYILFVGFSGSAAPTSKFTTDCFIVVLVVTINKISAIVIIDGDDCCYRSTVDTTR